MNTVTIKRLWAVAFLALLLTQSVAAQVETAAVPAVSSPAITPIAFKPFRRGITETAQLPAVLQGVRRGLIAGKRLRTADLRALADAGDSLAQMRFAKQLSEMADPSLVQAQIHYFAMAAYNGRDGAVRPLLSLLRGHSPSLNASALANAEAALMAQAAHGQIDAMAGLAKFYMAGAPFGAKAIEGQSMLSKVAMAGDHQAALDLALQLIGDRQDAAKLSEARQYLEIAATSPDLAIKAMALSLLADDSEI